MKLKNFRIKQGITREDLLNAGCKVGGTWITPNAELYITKDIDPLFKKDKAGFSINIAFPHNLEEWNEVEDILIIDETYSQPCMIFYQTERGKDVRNFILLECLIREYNEFLSRLSFLEEVN